MPTLPSPFAFATKVTTAQVPATHVVQRVRTTRTMNLESPSFSLPFDATSFAGDGLDGFGDEYLDEYDVDVLENLSLEVGLPLADRQFSTSSAASLQIDSLHWPSSPSPRVNNDFCNGDFEPPASNENIPPASNENSVETTLVASTTPFLSPLFPSTALSPLSQCALNANGPQTRPRKLPPVIVLPSRDWSRRVEKRVPSEAAPLCTTAPFTPPSVRDSRQSVAPWGSRLSPEQQRKHREWAVKRKRVKPGTSYKYETKADVARKRKREDGKFETRKTAQRKAAQASSSAASFSS